MREDEAGDTVPVLRERQGEAARASGVFQNWPCDLLRSCAVEWQRVSAGGELEVVEPRVFVKIEASGRCHRQKVRLDRMEMSSHEEPKTLAGNARMSRSASSSRQSAATERK